MKLGRVIGCRDAVSWVVPISGLLLLAGGLFAWWVLGSGNIDNGGTVTTTPSRLRGESQRVGQRSSAGPNASQNPVASAKEPEIRAAREVQAFDPFQQVPKTRMGLPLEDDPFVAESEEERRWLDRNGYPNAVQWESYTQASDYELSLAAD